MGADGGGPASGGGEGVRLTGDAALFAEMEVVREGQRLDLRDALRRLRAATAERLSEETVLSAFSVKSRLAERPEWFREGPAGTWRLTPEGEGA